MFFVLSPATMAVLRLGFLFHSALVVRTFSMLICECFHISGIGFTIGVLATIMNASDGATEMFSAVSRSFSVQCLWIYSSRATVLPPLPSAMYQLLTVDKAFSEMSKS